MNDIKKIEARISSETNLINDPGGKDSFGQNLNRFTNWLSTNIADSIHGSSPRINSLLNNLPKESIVRLKYIKKRNDTSSKIFRETEHLPASIRKFEKEEKPIAITDSTKITRTIRKPVYLSPEKIPDKYKSARKLLRFAEKSNLNKSPINTPLISNSTDKNVIIQNLYFKNQSYFYSNKIDLKTLIRSIYYQGQQIEQLKDFLLPTFKKIGSNQSYFETIFEEAKYFSETVKKFASKKISKLLELSSSFKMTGGIEDLLQSSFFTEDLKNLMKKSSSYKFRSFSSASKGYISVIELLYQQYKHLEQINLEIEKLTHIYLNNYLNDGASIDFDTFNFHSRMFVACVYNDRLIHEFILFIYKTLKNSNFYLNNYPRICEMVFEIYENFEQNISSTVNKNNDKMNDKNNPEKDINILNPGSNFVIVQTKEIIKEKNKNENLQKPIIKSETLISDQRNNEQEDETTKKNKKKKRNKKKKNKSENQIPTVSEFGNSCQDIKVEIYSEDSAEILKELEKLECMFCRVDNLFKLEDCQKNISVDFSYSELKSIDILVK